MMPREKKGKNPMTSKKRVAQTPPISSKQQEQWQPNGPCKILQLQRALVMDILSRLTINTLFNCRCVCKAWLSLISDPQFAHLCISRSPIGILIKTFPPKSITRRLDFAQIEESADSRWRLEKMRFTPKTSLPISEFNLMNSCNGLICLSGPERGGLLYVCNPVLGEFITIERSGKGRPSFNCVGLGFSVGTGEYKVLQSFLQSSEPVTSYNYEAEIYTIGTGFWRSIGKASGSLGPQLPFNAYLHGALHWISCFRDVPELINSFNFETEQFQALPPPSYFGPLQKQFSDCLKLGVWEGCLVLCVFGDDSSKFVMWVMKDYGVQESWTKFLVIVENLVRRTPFLSLHEPIMFLSNGEILMVHNNWDVVCYNKEKKSFREIRLTGTRSSFSFNAIAYSPSFVSLYDVSRGEEVKRVRAGNKSDKLRAVGSSDCVGSGMPPYKNTKLN